MCVILPPVREPRIPRAKVRLRTSLTIFAHSGLMSGPIDTKPSANER
jgi:hypothetical protein